MDHVYVNILDAAVEQGEIDKAVAENYLRRDAITSYIGIWELKFPPAKPSYPPELPLSSALMVFIGY